MLVRVLDNLQRQERRLEETSHSEASYFVLFTEHYSRDQIEEDTISRAYNKRGGEKKLLQMFGRKS
jgi:hypothetical protein